MLSRNMMLLGVFRSFTSSRSIAFGGSLTTWSSRLSSRWAGSSVKGPKVTGDVSNTQNPMD